MILGRKNCRIGLVVVENNYRKNFRKTTVEWISEIKRAATLRT